MKGILPRRLLPLLVALIPEFLGPPLPGREAEPAPAPLPDLAGAEPQVAAKISAAHRYATSRPASAHAWGALAMNLHVHGYPAEALPAYERAAALAPEDFRWPYYRAIAVAEVGSPEAPAAFAAAGRVQQGYAPLLVRQGDALATAGRFEEAAAAFAAAVTVDPALSQAHLGLARRAIARGDLDAAFAHARRAAEADPDSADAHGLLAEVHRRRGEPVAAAAERRLQARLPPVARLRDPVYRSLVAEGVSSTWYRQRGRAYLEQGEHQAAAAELQHALAAAPTPETHDDLGLALQGLGRFGEAAAEHRAALALRPAYAEARAHLAEALAGLGRLGEAVTTLEQALSEAPGLPHGHLNLGTLYARAGRRREAVAAFRDGLEGDPDEPRLQARLAWLLATAPEDDLRDGEGAVRLAEAANAATSGELPEALDVLAAAYAEAGRFPEAAVTARRALLLARARAGGEELARQLEERLRLYQAGRPYRDE